MIRRTKIVTPPSSKQMEGIELLPLPCKTPLTSKSIRRVQREYRSNPTLGKLDLLFRSQTALAAQHEIDLHVQTGLFETLKDEKKRRQRSKRMNLVREQVREAEL